MTVKDETASYVQATKVPPAPFSPPTTAWLTWVLFLILYPLWIFFLWHHPTTTDWPYAGAYIVLLSICSYVLFTPLHEASHGMLTRLGWLNNFIGRMTSLTMGPTGSFSAYRYLHMTHHSNTNDPKEDPDYYSGMGPRWFLPLSWLTTDLYYYYFYLRRMHTRPLRERVCITLENLVCIGLLILCFKTGMLLEALLFWVVPARIASTLLSITFNYVPHYPYDTLQKDDPFRATRIILGWQPLTTLVFTFHNYHLMHHLYPRFPFYLYPKLWRCSREVALQNSRICNLKSWS